MHIYFEIWESEIVGRLGEPSLEPWARWMKVQGGWQKQNATEEH